MKTTNEKVYRCDHCNKAMVSKGFMVLHERMCKQNPNNQHQCFKYCKYLSKTVDSEEDEFGYKYNPETMFKCTHLQSFINGNLYSYKLERFKNKQHRIESMIRMPLECELYEPQEGHDYSDHSGETFNDYDFFDI
jgi:hypothetical protein